METDTVVAMEWACKLKSERSLYDVDRTELVGLFRHVPRYRGQDISLMMFLRHKKVAQNRRARIRQEGLSAKPSDIDNK